MHPIVANRTRCGQPGREPEGCRPAFEARPPPRYENAGSAHSAAPSNRDRWRFPAKDPPSGEPARPFRITKTGSIANKGFKADRIEVDIKEARKKKTIMLLDNGQK